MRFLMLVVADPDLKNPDPEPMPIESWVNEMVERGVDITGERLRPPANATTVRRRGGELVVTDGPFAETREYIAGFDILEVKDLDEAIEIASKHPMAALGTIDLRPFWPLELDLG
jgi:hypothetical protein